MTRQKIDMVLISKARQGDQKAFTKLYNYYHAYIFTYIFCILKDHHDSEDQTMITFEKAFRKLNTYYPLFLFKTWLVKIARMTALDFIKYKKIRMFSDLELSHAMHVRNIENPANILIEKEEVEQLKIAIAHLPKVRKDIVTLRMMGFKCREISGALHVTTNSVIGQLQYIKRKLAV